MSRPCEINPVLQVTGGGINQHEAECHAWIIKPITIKIDDEDRDFGDIYIGDYHCKQFLGTNYKMVEHIKSLRNQKVRDLMLDLGKAEDPNEENPTPADILSMPKKELYDQLPKTITLDVATTSMVTSITVLPSWRDTAVLQIEINATNLDLLLEEPLVAPTPFRPEIAEENVKWIASRGIVQCKYWDSKEMRMRTKSISAGISRSMSKECKQELIHSAAAEVQAYYDTHHNHLNNMPGQTAMSEEEEEAMPAEPAHGEPVQKAARTEPDEESSD